MVKRRLHGTLEAFMQSSCQRASHSSELSSLAALFHSPRSTQHSSTNDKWPPYHIAYQSPGSAFLLLSAASALSDILIAARTADGTNLHPRPNHTKPPLRRHPRLSAAANPRPVLGHRRSLHLRPGDTNRNVEAQHRLPLRRPAG